jgi:hypothetical protein
MLDQEGREPLAARPCHALGFSLQGGRANGNAPRSLRATRVCEPANPVRKGLAVVLDDQRTR